MKLKALIGSGGKVMGLALPFMIAGLAANIAWPGFFRLGLGKAGLAAGLILLALGIPMWLGSVIQIARYVPRKRLITTGPFAILAHPLYTSVALLVLPGCGLSFDSWVGLPIGFALYLSARLFAPEEERLLRKYFPAEYPAYRSKVLLPWL